MTDFRIGDAIEVLFSSFFGHVRAITELSVDDEPRRKRVTVTTEVTGVRHICPLAVWRLIPLAHLFAELTSFFFLLKGKSFDLLLHVSDRLPDGKFFFGQFNFDYYN